MAPFSAPQTTAGPVLAEVSRAYAAVGVCLFTLGAVTQAALATALAADARPAGSVQVSSSIADVPHILGANLVFFLVVSLLPILNSVMVGQQLFVLGMLAYQIHGLPAAVQIDLLYRHTAFEVVALFAAVRISYIAYFGMRDYISREAQSRRDLAVRLRSVLPLYALIAVVTVIGALLEGHVYVHL